MKTAALIFGVLAGIIGLAIAALGTLDTGLVAEVDMGSHASVIAHFVLAVIPGISLLGAGLALARPKFGAVLLLLSALAWVGVALLAGHGALLFAAAPFTFAAAAAWVAFFARRDVDLPEAPPTPSFGLARTGLSPDERWPDQGQPDPRDPRLRGPREEPDFGNDARRNPGPEYEDEGYRSEPFDEERGDDRPRFAPAFDDEPDADGPPGENYVSTRREYAAAPQEYVRSSPEYALPSQRDPYQEFESYAQPQRRGSRVRQVVGIINLALFVAIVTGISLFLYFDYQQGAHSLIFGSHGTTAAATTAPAAAATAPQTPLKAPAASIVTPADTAPQTPAAPPLAPAATTASVAPGTYDDPLPFCSAVQTIDAPDPRYVGPNLPPVIAAALQIPISSPPDQVHWRCLNRTLMGCFANNTHKCDMTPTVKEMLSYCSANPGAKDLSAPNGTWFCSGTTPVIPKDQKWPVDARGFYPDAWILVPPAGTLAPAG